MTRYRVCFEQKWRGDFDELDDALAWGREVGDSGRLVHVARFGLFRTRLVAVFPEERAEEGSKLWKARVAGSTAAGGAWF
jgi:hypothetical protein